MNVLLVSPFPPPTGGIESWTKRMLEIGLPDGWNIIHVNSNVIGPRVENTHGKKPLRYEVLRCFRVWKNVIKALKKNDIKVVHICLSCIPTGLAREIITAIISRIARKPVILHCRCTVPNVVDTKFRLRLFKMMGRHCAGIIALNKLSADFAKKHTKANVKQIANFVSSLETESKNSRNYNDTLKDVTYVGRVLPTKGCDVMIEAARTLPNIKFHLVGPVTDEIKAMEVTDNVIFHGDQKREDVKKFLEETDAFIFLSRYYAEGFSNSLVEAMAAGLPCIVTDWSANADMIEDKGGIIVKDNSCEAFIDALKMIEDKDIRQKMGNFNINKALNDYSEGAIIPQYVKFYEELLRDKK